MRTWRSQACSSESPSSCVVYGISKASGFGSRSAAVSSVWDPGLMCDLTARRGVRYRVTVITHSMSCCWCKSCCPDADDCLGVGAGVTGVKVDCQAGVGMMGSRCGGGPLLAASFHAALEESIARHFPGNHCINCMAHSTENIYRQAFMRTDASAHPASMQ